MLAVLGVWFPDVVPWDALLAYLADDRVAGELKRGACQVLGARASQLPETVRSSLRELAPQLIDTDPVDRILGRPLAGAALGLAAAVEGIDDQTLTRGLTSLLTGGKDERYAAAMVIADLGRAEYSAALTALLSDRHLDVRAAAAYALAVRVASPAGNDDQLAIAGLQRALADPGARVALATANGITATDAPSAQARELLAPLLNHASAQVRATAARANS